MKNTAIIIQARMGSSRLPGKVMKKIIDKPMIEYLLMRVSNSKLADQIIVATSDKKENKPLIQFLKKNKIFCFLGDEYDVLSRYYFAAKKFKVKHIVRITADCPIIDPFLIDNVIRKYFKDKVDYTSNIFPRTFPKGLDIEIFSIDTLEKTYLSETSDYDREHVTSYMRDSGNFKLSNYSIKNDFSFYRLTVDWKEDFDLIDQIFNIFYPDILFKWLDVIEIIKKTPYLFEINKNLK